MALNHATWKQRLWIGLVAFFVLLFFLWAVSDIPKIWRLSHEGAIVTGQISTLHPEPKDSRAYSTFRYTYNDSEYQGAAPGVSGYAVGDSVEVTVDRANPRIYWVGNAPRQLLREIAWLLIGTLWLALGAAFLVRIPLWERP